MPSRAKAQREEQNRAEQRRAEQRRAVLRNAGERFADEITALLNCTVCHGIRVVAQVQRDNVHVGYKLDKLTLLSAEAVPVTLGSSRPAIYINVDFRLDLDPDGDHLRVQESNIALSLDKDREQVLVHYDYERNKEKYPEAHVQVCAESPAWQTLCRRIEERNPERDEQSLERLHLPVGGRRYRPTLEDVIEFLIKEKIADSRTGAAGVLENSRKNFAEIQLKAAVRRNPEPALAVLVEMGLATRLGD